MCDRELPPGGPFHHPASELSFCCVLAGASLGLHFCGAPPIVRRVGGVHADDNNNFNNRRSTPPMLWRASSSCPTGRSSARSSRWKRPSGKKHLFFFVFFMYTLRTYITGVPNRNPSLPLAAVAALVAVVCRRSSPARLTVWILISVSACSCSASAFLPGSEGTRIGIYISR